MNDFKKVALFPAFNNPPLILASMVIGICLAFGLVLLVSHTVIYDYAAIPYIAWPWALPVFIGLVAYNIEIARTGENIEVSWRIFGFTVKRSGYHVSTVSWVPFGNKQKYLTLCSGQDKIFVCSKQKATIISALIS